MFSKAAVRSREEIKKGLLTRAFKRGGQEEYEKMELLIEWRLAACRHSNEKALNAFEDSYNASAFNQTPQEDSRWMNATNFIAHAEGRDERFRNTTHEEKIAILKAQIKADQPAVDRHNKLMDIIWNAPKIDLKAIRNSRPDAPIIIDAPEPVLHNLRSEHDPIFQVQKEKPSEVGSHNIRQSVFGKNGAKPTFH